MTLISFKKCLCFQFFMLITLETNLSNLIIFFVRFLHYRFFTIYFKTDLRHTIIVLSWFSYIVTDNMVTKNCCITLLFVFMLFSAGYNLIMKKRKYIKWDTLIPKYCSRITKQCSDAIALKNFGNVMICILQTKSIHTSFCSLQTNILHVNGSDYYFHKLCGRIEVNLKIRNVLYMTKSTLTFIPLQTFGYNISITEFNLAISNGYCKCQYMVISANRRTDKQCGNMYPWNVVSTRTINFTFHLINDGFCRAQEKTRHGINRMSLSFSASNRLTSQGIMEDLVTFDNISPEFPYHFVTRVRRGKLIKIIGKRKLRSQTLIYRQYEKQVGRNIYGHCAYDFSINERWLPNYETYINPKRGLLNRPKKSYETKIVLITDVFLMLSVNLCNIDPSIEIDIYEGQQVHYSALLNKIRYTVGNTTCLEFKTSGHIALFHFLIDARSSKDSYGEIKFVSGGFELKEYIDIDFKSKIKTSLSLPTSDLCKQKSFGTFCKLQVRAEEPSVTPFTKISASVTKSDGHNPVNCMYRGLYIAQSYNLYRRFTHDGSYEKCSMDFTGPERNLLRQYSRDLLYPTISLCDKTKLPFVSGTIKRVLFIAFHHYKINNSQFKVHINLMRSRCPSINIYCGKKKQLNMMEYLYISETITSSLGLPWRRLGIQYFLQILDFCRFLIIASGVAVCPSSFRNHSITVSPHPKYDCIRLYHFSRFTGFNSNKDLCTFGYKGNWNPVDYVRINFEISKPDCITKNITSNLSPPSVFITFNRSCGNLVGDITTRKEGYFQAKRGNEISFMTHAIVSLPDLFTENDLQESFNITVSSNDVSWRLIRIKNSLSNSIQVLMDDKDRTHLVTSKYVTHCESLTSPDIYKSFGVLPTLMTKITLKTLKVCPKVTIEITIFHLIYKHHACNRGEEIKTRAIWPVFAVNRRFIVSLGDNETVQLHSTLSSHIRMITLAPLHSQYVSCTLNLNINISNYSMHIQHGLGLHPQGIGFHSKNACNYLYSIMKSNYFHSLYTVTTVNKVISWQQAEDLCLKVAGNLPSISSSEEYTLIRKLMLDIADSDQNETMIYKSPTRSADQIKIFIKNVSIH